MAKIIEGLRIGINKALQALEDKTLHLKGLQDPLLYAVALIAGRQHEDIARLVVEAAGLMGQQKLLEPGVKLSEVIRAKEGASNQVISGVLLDKEPLNTEMPRKLGPVKLLVIDDALEPEEIEDEALGTEKGFARYLELQQEFKHNLQKVVELGVNLILVDRGTHDLAEEVFTDAGILVLQRVANRELRQAAEHCGAKLIKRTGLKKEPEELARYLGKAEEAYLDERLRHVLLLGGQGKAQATIMVGASTEEVVGERERIAKDAASAVQAAVKGGVVAGGGALELALARKVEEARKDVRGMAAYGLDCVISALKRPFAQIILNAGFNSLEKLGDVIAAQAETHNDSLGIDCDTGEIADMTKLGVYDPALVKKHAIKAAGEIAEAILRIDTIIKKKEQPGKAAQEREEI